MPLLKAFFLLLFYLPLSYAVSEKQFNEIVVKKLYPSIEQWSQSKSFKGHLGKKIHYRVYGKASPHSQPIVIVPGWAEFSLKYMELAYDLIQKSFSPIYVLDHRGQGESERQLSNPRKSYVKDFLFYTKDFKTFLNTKVLPHHPNKKLYLMAHSMGGVVALFYILDQPNTFQSVAITSPMLRINVPEPLQSLALILSSFPYQIFQNKSVPLVYRTNKIPFDSKNPNTHSLVRYEFIRRLENSHPVYIREITFKWLEEAIRKSRMMREKIDKISTPYLLLNAGKDQVIDNKASEGLCLKSKKCSLITIKKAKHEILMEEDEIRNKALKHIFKFFNKP